MNYTSHESVGGLVRGALDDVRELVREELLLARVELRQELNKASAAGMQFGAAGVSLMFAAAFLFIALALGISAAFEWPAWAGFGIVAVLLTIAGVVFVSGGRKAVREVRPLPKTVQTIKENFK
jgi:hypothetical protein